MPPACPVEPSRSPLPSKPNTNGDATGLPGGALTLAATLKTQHEWRCHRLARWSLTLAATLKPNTNGDATGLPGGALTLAATPRTPTNQKMPPACPVEPSRSPLLLEPPRIKKDATGLSGGALTLAATPKTPTNQKMPPACPVEPSRSPLLLKPPRIKKMPPACPVEHSRSPLPSKPNTNGDATGLPGGALRSQLLLKLPLIKRCHRLARWSLTFAATLKTQHEWRCHRLAR